MKIGITATSSRTVSISENANNTSILFTGDSGSGKSYTMQKIEQNIATAGGVVLVIDYNGTHELIQDSGNIHRIDLYEKGLPFPLICPCRRPDGSKEDIEEAVEAAVDVFGNTDRLTVRQRNVLRTAFLETLSVTGEVFDFRKVIRSLKEKNSDAAQSVLTKLYPMSRLKVVPDPDFLKRGRICILGLDKFNLSAQEHIAEMVMSTLWRYFRLWGQRMDTPLFIALDEFQDLNTRSDSILSQVLREGRKFNMSLLLATQTLESFSKGQTATIMQAATHLYFRPAPNEIRKVARYTGAESLPEMEKRLRGLKKGECIAVGNFRIGNLEYDSPIKLRN